MPRVPNRLMLWTETGGGFVLDSRLEAARAPKRFAANMAVIPAMPGKETPTMPALSDRNRFSQQALTPETASRPRARTSMFFNLRLPIPLHIIVMLPHDPFEPFVFGDRSNLDWPTHRLRTRCEAREFNGNVDEEFCQIYCILNWHRCEDQWGLQHRRDCTNHLREWLLLRFGKDLVGYSKQVRTNTQRQPSDGFGLATPADTHLILPAQQRRGLGHTINEIERPSLSEALAC